MSYSSQTKEELCRFEPESVCCMLAELAGCLVGLQVAKRISSELARKAIGVLCTGLGVFLLLRQILEF